MNFVSDNCAAQSLGPANELFGALVQTILAVQCAISPSHMWPVDFGPNFLQNGIQTSTKEMISFSMKIFH